MVEPTSLELSGLYIFFRFVVRPLKITKSLSHLLPWLADGVVDWVGDDVVEEDDHLGHRQADVHNHPAQKHLLSLLNFLLTHTIPTGVADLKKHKLADLYNIFLSFSTMMDYHRIYYKRRVLI